MRGIGDGAVFLWLDGVKGIGLEALEQPIGLDGFLVHPFDLREAILGISQRASGQNQTGGQNQNALARRKTALRLAVQLGLHAAANGFRGDGMPRRHGQILFLPIPEQFLNFNLH